MSFELVGMDHPAHDLSTEEYRKLNPFEQIPVIDDDGLVLTESVRLFCSVLGSSMKKKSIAV